MHHVVHDEIGDVMARCPNSKVYETGQCDAQLLFAECLWQSMFSAKRKADCREKCAPARKCESHPTGLIGNT